MGNAVAILMGPLLKESRQSCGFAPIAIKECCNIDIYIFILSYYYLYIIILYIIYNAIVGNMQ